MTRFDGSRSYSDGHVDANLCSGLIFPVSSFGICSTTESGRRNAPQNPRDKVGESPDISGMPDWGRYQATRQEEVSSSTPATPLYTKSQSRITMADTDYKAISKIAQKRRATNIAVYYTTPPAEESQLPNNLTDHSLKSGYYTTSELEIIQSEASEILQKIHSQTWTSTTVARAFCKASAYAQSLTNCLTEVLYAEALERAQYLDEYMAQHGQPIGPLHGLPISLKDCFITAPHPSSIGMAAFANEPLQTDTLLVKILRDLGAVFYVKTNVPTAMMMVRPPIVVRFGNSSLKFYRCSCSKEIFFIQL